MDVVSKRMWKVFIVELLLSKTDNIFESMEIVETMFEGVVEPSSKKTTRNVSNQAGRTKQMRGEDASSKLYIEMGKRAGKCKKRYVDRPRYRWELPVNYPYIYI